MKTVEQLTAELVEKEAELTAEKTEHAETKKNLTKANGEAKDRREKIDELNDQIKGLVDSEENSSGVVQALKAAFDLKEDIDPSEIVESLQEAINANKDGVDVAKKIQDLKVERSGFKTKLTKAENSMKDVLKVVDELKADNNKYVNESIDNVIYHGAYAANIKEEAIPDVAILVRSRVKKIEKSDGKFIASMDDGDSMELKDAVQKVLETDTFKHFVDKKKVALRIEQSGFQGSNETLYDEKNPQAYVEAEAKRKLGIK